MSIHLLVEYAIFFILCSFLGWLLEEIWIFLRFRKVVNRGFLIGPLCPIYGIGALVGSGLAATPLAAHPGLIFLISALGGASIEYASSFVLEKIFGVRWWDYSDRPFNLHGRVCLLYSLAFGICGLAIVYGIHPAFFAVFAKIPAQLTYIIFALLATLFLIDLTISTIIIKGFRKIKKTAPRDDSEDITAYVRSVLADRGALYRRLNNFDFFIGRVKVLHYKEFTDDLVENSGQSLKLPKNYQWIRKHNRPVLFFLGRVWAGLYRLLSKTTYVNREILSFDGPCFIYANHTHPLGDILAPVDYCAGHRPRLLASPANLGIPIIGRFLPDLGALPVPTSLHGLAKLDAAVAHYAKQKNPIIIYPEAHVWPYYTKIRPFTSAAFAYPVKNHAATFVATTTYQKRKPGKRPRRTIYFTGPFYPDATKPRREQAKDLCEQVHAAMEKSAKHNNIKYVKYIHDS